MATQSTLHTYLSTHPLSPENTRSIHALSGYEGRPKYSGQFSGQANTHRTMDDVVDDIKTGHAILGTPASTPWGPSVSSHGDAELIGYTINKHKYIAREEASRRGN